MISENCKEQDRGSFYTSVQRYLGNLRLERVGGAEGTSHTVAPGPGHSTAVLALELGDMAQAFSL